MPTAEYMRRWRSQRTEQYAWLVAQNKARQRAAVRLAALYPKKFDALYAEELAKDPVKKPPRGYVRLDA